MRIQITLLLHTHTHYNSHPPPFPSWPAGTWGGLSWRGGERDFPAAFRAFTVAAECSQLEESCLVIILLGVLEEERWQGIHVVTSKVALHIQGCTAKAASPISSLSKEKTGISKLATLQERVKTSFISQWNQALLVLGYFCRSVRHCCVRMMQKCKYRPKIEIYVFRSATLTCIFQKLIFSS